MARSHLLEIEPAYNGFYAKKARRQKEPRRRRLESDFVSPRDFFEALPKADSFGEEAEEFLRRRRAVRPNSEKC